MTKIREPFFISDTHFNHTNIIRYSKRPFTNVSQMNEALISYWNAKVDPEDQVYHLGDVGFPKRTEGSSLYEILSRLNGRKYLCVGNHDLRIVERDQRFCSQFEWIKDVHTMKHNGQGIFLSHYAHRVWNKSHRGVWHLYGHSHGSLPDDPHSLSFDVGVDCHKYTPLSFSDVAKIMAKKEWRSVDHHGKDTHEEDD